MDQSQDWDFCVSGKELDNLRSIRTEITADAVRPVLTDRFAVMNLDLGQYEAQDIREG